MMRILQWQVALAAFAAILLPSSCSAYSKISDETLRKIPDPGTDFDIHDGKLLAPILQTRTPGSAGSKAVQAHFAAFFRESLPKWTIEWQNSTSKTPVTGSKQIPFVNFIARRDPPAAGKGEVGRLNLVAHYDSKIEPEGFIGAIDSAAPCAMIMHAARSVDAALTKKWESMEADALGSATGIQILFMDGEEAFQTWTRDDSLYGARSLAEEWEQTYHPAMSTYQTELSSISLFMLLDLLGAPSPRIPSFFSATHWAYRNLAKLETRFRDLTLFHSPTKKSDRAGTKAHSLWLPDRDKSQFSRYNGIEDDHIPFLARGVEILHLIPSPFPKVWHKLTDDGEHLDRDVMRDWSVLITAFIAEWMELEGFIEDLTASVGSKESRDLEKDEVAAVLSKTEL